MAAGKMQRRVLVIEDNVDAAETLRDALERDIVLPGMDGYAVARAFRADERCPASAEGRHPAASAAASRSR